MNVGPRVLKGKAYNVQWLVLVYNLAMVALNFWMAKEMVVTTWSEYAWLRELIYSGLIIVLRDKINCTLGFVKGFCEFL